MQGKVIVFWNHRHYGFIGDVASSSEFFFHEDDLAPDSMPPAKGKLVTFEIGTWKGKPKATNVRVLPSVKEVLGGAR